MHGPSERRPQDIYAQAHAALVEAAEMIAPALAEAETGVVVVLDMAGMGDVNVRHGVPTGDRLLGAVEETLRARLSGTGQVARLAGDQFLVLVTGTPSAESLVASILNTVARTRVRDRWGRSVRLRTRVGVATWRDEAGRRAAISTAGDALSKARYGSACDGMS
jgi:diguanylate cyclase (GGDEF)-like protein